MTGRVRVERDGAIGWLIFDQIERRNAINTAMWAAIPAAVGELDGDPEVRVIVLRGAGTVAFVSGADVSEFEEARNADRAAQYAALNGCAFAALAGAEKPVVAMIHGFCIGGGTAIALNADLRYAADDAQFGIPAARLGLGYEAESIECLARLVGPSTAAEMLFTARRYRAEEALRVGLVNAVVPKGRTRGLRSRRRSDDRHERTPQPAQRQAGAARTRSISRTTRHAARRRVHPNLPRQRGLSRGRAGIPRKTPAEVPGRITTTVGSRARTRKSTAAVAGFPQAGSALSV